MVLKRLRKSRNLTQEQLASMSGLNVRTIQRIESGKKAGLETLKSLASVLEVTISTLEQEITVIDKTTEEWKKLPLMFRLNFIGTELGWLGMSKREDWVNGEKLIVKFALLFSLVLIIAAFAMGEFKREVFLGPLSLIAVAYGISNVIRTGDQYEIW